MERAELSAMEQAKLGSSLKGAHNSGSVRMLPDVMSEKPFGTHLSLDASRGLTG